MQPAPARSMRAQPQTTSCPSRPTLRLSKSRPCLPPRSAALHGLRDAGKVQPGQKVLINGASGGVGTFAVQIAKSFGAEVTGVCSTRNVDMVRSIGADHVIDYTQEDFTQGAQRYDLILDNVANRSFSDCRRVLTPQGRHIPNSGHAGMSYVFKTFVRSTVRAPAGSPVPFVAEQRGPGDPEGASRIRQGHAGDRQDYSLSEVSEALAMWARACARQSRHHGGGFSMKAVVCTKYGPPEVLDLREVEKPAPKQDEVLIKIHATSVTASDCIVRGFKLPRWSPLGISMAFAIGFTKPRKSILGMVLSGEIEAVGKDVKSFEVGDPVYGSTVKGASQIRFGAYAEYTCLPAESLIARKPLQCDRCTSRSNSVWGQPCPAVSAQGKYPERTERSDLRRVRRHRHDGRTVCQTFRGDGDRRLQHGESGAW